MVLKGTSKITVPERLRQNALNELHVSHLSTRKTLLRARMYVFWPGINAYIKELCEICEICKKFSVRQPSETLKHDLVSTKPWDTLAADIFELQGKLVLIIVDRYSKFICVLPVVDHTADKMILPFLQIFSKLGIHNTIQCDRGSNFLSKTFQEFFANLNISLQLSSSYYHSSNPAKRAVCTVKSIMKKCIDEKLGNNTWRIGLIQYLCIPISDSLPSLAEISTRESTKAINPFCVIIIHWIVGLRWPLINSLKEKRKEEKFYHERTKSVSDKLIIPEGQIYSTGTMLRTSVRRVPL